jgi:hypothetical protein
MPWWSGSRENGRSNAVNERTRLNRPRKATQIGRQTLTELALAHAYDTTFWWTAGFFAAGAVIGGALLRRGPLAQSGNPSSARGGVPTAPAEAGPGQLNVQA